jgi:hypothetical protein
MLLLQSSTVWYTQGAAIVSGTDTDLTNLYIEGDMKFGGTTTVPAVMTIKGSRVKLTGDLLNDTPAGVTGTLFASLSSSEAGFFEFCGTTAQKITTSATTYASLPSKQANYINFPHLEINNEAHVTMDARLAAKTQDIELTKGWLILDSEVASSTNSDNGDEDSETILAHLLVEGDINYNENLWSATEPNKRGFIQVNLKAPTDGTNNGVSSLVGFGIPFEKMYPDYFAFNTLLEPKQGYNDGGGFLAGPPIIDPETYPLTRGKGYVFGIDLRGPDPFNYGVMEDYSALQFANRALNGYQFNRHNYANGSSSTNQIFGTADLTQDAYAKEKLNTESVDVEVTDAGYVYLANPFTCPLNIDQLLVDGITANDWGITAGDIRSEKPDVRNVVWVLNPNSKATVTEDARRSNYDYTYLVAQRTGGTYYGGDRDYQTNSKNDGSPDDEYRNVNGTLIAPLQMFLVRAYTSAVTKGKITIPKSQRVMGNPRFLRRASEDDRRRDDFIVEFRDRTTRTTDRASIVLRTQEELAANASYINVERLKIADPVEGSNSTRAAKADGDFPQNTASQIYTKDAAGKALTVQFLPMETTTTITLHHIPPLQAQPLHILGLRLGTKDQIKHIWLVDSKYGTEFELIPGTRYETYSEPDDSHERFTLRFSTIDEEATGNSLEKAAQIFAYASDGNIYAGGFGTQYAGSRVELLDTNGRLVTAKNAGEETLLLLENYTPGVYIVRLNAPERPQLLKLIAK